GDSVTLKATYNNLFFSEYIEGSSNNKAIEFYNGTGKTINLDNFAVLTNYNGGSWSGEYTFPSGTTLNDGETYVVANSSADQTILDEADETLSFNEKGYIVGFNGNDVRALVQYTPNGDTVILDQIGRYDMVDPGNGWDVAGVTDGTEDHTLIRKPNAGPNLGDWDASAGTDSISSEWYVMPQDDFSDLGTHTTNLSNKAYASVSYLWSNGATTESITVAPSTDQTYTVTLTDAMGCTNVDTVDVTVNDLPDVDLGADSMFVCAADTATLYAGDFDAYNWSTGETTDSIMVDSSGIGLNSEMITVSVTDSLGCMNTDTIMLTFVDYPSVNIAGPDTFKYYTETATYDAGSGFASYLWSTGATTQDITIDSSDVNLGTNTISVTVSNDYGCETTEDKDIYADDDSGTEDINDDMQISVYPNPNAGIFTLEINGPKEDFNLEIMNVKGQLIQSEQINANEFSKQYDFSNLSGGIYYIRLINEDMTKTQKLIIR
ncbi:MAG: T9SS type A sorting domain-containing protein, partial [Bacteroidales bacterium]